MQIAEQAAPAAGQAIASAVAGSPAEQAAHFTDDIIYRLDRDLHQNYLNPAGHDLLELDHETGMGKSWLVFLHEEDRPRMRAELERVLRTGADACDVEARLVGVRGRITRARHRLRAIREGGDGTGEIVGVLGIARDLAEVRRVEEQLQQSQKLETIGLLASGIAHDFNNMLAAILGYTELMLEDKQPGEPDHRALSYIHTSTERAAALVKQILVFSRKSTIQLKPIRIGTLIEETLQMLQRTLPKTIRIASHVEDKDARVLGDPVRIQQALMNLCLNARDAMPHGGELRIEADVQIVEPPAEPSRADAAADLRPGEYVRIKVQDTGSGMPPDVLQQIWNPFFTTKASGEGTGLGLSVVNGIVKTHHGAIQVESQVGRGTTFFVYLPVASANQDDGAQALAEPPGGEETILIVDDEPVLLDLLFDLLHPKGYHVLAANTCEEALEFVDAVGDKIDLVISDNMMPGMTGRELAREIRNRQPRTKILVCSGFSPTRESELGEMDYAPSYVQKPYQRRDLLNRVREALDSHEA